MEVHLLLSVWIWHHGLGRAQQWRRCKHLIIDDISMVDSTYFDKLEAVASAVKEKENIPFGGI